MTVITVARHCTIRVLFSRASVGAVGEIAALTAEIQRHLRPGGHVYTGGIGPNAVPVGRCDVFSESPGGDRVARAWRDAAPSCDHALTSYM